MIPVLTAFPGYRPAVGGLTSMPRVAQSSTSTLPSGIQAGDILLGYALAGSAFESFGPTLTAPSGWTRLHWITGTILTATSLEVFGKIASGSESSTTPTLTWDTELFAAPTQLYVVLRPNSTVTSFGTVAGKGGQETGTNPAAQVVSSGSGVAPLLVIGAHASNNAVNPRTMSPAKDDEYGSTGAWLTWKFYSSSPSDVTVDQDDEGNYNELISCYVQLNT